MDLGASLDLGVWIWCFSLSLPAAAPKKDPIISIGPTGKLIYSSDSQGNRVPDFSHCGYAGGDRPIPDAPIRVVVPPIQGDSTARIQRAIDYVANLPLDTNGLRGAVLLLRGRHEISGSLRLATSGVVLRGQGMDENGTLLVATGEDRRTLIRIIGRPSPSSSLSPRVSDSGEITDDYISVGATSFHLKQPSTLKPGDTINIIRPSTQLWIDRLGMTDFGGGIGDWRLVWKPGSRDLVWDRVVKSIEGDVVTIGAPITTAIEKSLGGGRVEAYSWPGRIENVGIENLRCESTFDSANPKDENHSWFVITIENAQNAWVRQITATHFAGSMVAIYENSKRVTVEDCLSLAPVSEEAGYRRHTFFTMGQLCLFLHCHAEYGRHDFCAGHCAAGPNAFVQCDATAALADSGPIESWASSVLYDNVTIDGNGLSLANRGPNPHGAGWAAANSVLWQCSASFIRCANPPAARNWAFGCWGEFEGDGIWRSSNESVKPDSLYLAQLTDQLGPDAASRVKLLRRSTEESTNPTLDQAAQLIAASRQPATQLAAYIAAASTRNPIPSDPGNVRNVDEIESAGSGHPLPPGEGRGEGDCEFHALSPATNSAFLTPHSALVLTNGWLICNGRLLIGARTNIAWWRGNLRPNEAPLAEPGITRFVPGRIGPGFTDDLTELADGLSTNSIAALDHHYGLWYDRRRDDHERVRRMTGDVWPPFYEQPFSRSGLGTSWDGLSRYDLTKYNPWYWSRLKHFADLCDQRDLVLFHENYFQHNILEAGAHWADFPWRSANNINNTGFPEPPPYAGDKRIFMAELFYDMSQPARRALHRAYIRKCLDNFADNPNVIQFTGAEFTGPLSFVQFWLDTITQWKNETGHRPLIALSCTKDVQDSILSDSTRRDAVDLIDFRYWWQTERGLFAPKGGQNLAPRQFERQWKGGRPTDLDVARMTAEYRQRYLTKPVICDFPQASWAYLCAGGSMPNLPRTTDARLLAAIPHMQPWPEACKDNHWVLREPGRQYLIYCAADSPRELDFSHENGNFDLQTINMKTGVISETVEQLSLARFTKFGPQNSSPVF